MQSTFKFKILKCLTGEHHLNSFSFFCEITIGKHGTKIGLAPAKQKCSKKFLTEKLHETSTYGGN
jgi:hypothetical protein